MSKLTQIRPFTIELNNNISNLENIIDKYLNNIKSEHKEIVNKLIKDICDGEGLDYNIIKDKYLKKKEEVVSSEILDKIEINNQVYYYEKKEDGKVYNNNLVIIGKYTNNNIVLN
jgi:hypothetical protein